MVETDTTDRADREGVEFALGEALSLTELLETPDLARVYIHVLRTGPVTGTMVKDRLDMPKSTTYKYTRQLEEMGLVTRHGDEPQDLTAEPLQLLIEADGHSVDVTPALIGAVAAASDDDDLQTFIDRHSIPKFGRAVELAVDHFQGTLTQRMAASEMDVHPVEAMEVISALEPVLTEAQSYDPYLPEMEHLGTDGGE